MWGPSSRAPSMGLGVGGPLDLREEDSVNGFKDSEIVTVSGRAFPCIGGRLRIVHELHKDKLSIETELVDYQIDQYAVVRARVTTIGGTFSATGTATAARDPKLVDSLLELAESRACARSLRLSGVGVETCGFEELGAGPLLQDEPPRQDLRTVPPRPNGAAGNGNGYRGTPCTSAQRRALHSLARQLGQDLETFVAKVFPDGDADHLTLSQASALIDKMKIKASNGNGAGAGR